METPGGASSRRTRNSTRGAVPRNCTSPRAGQPLPEQTEPLVDTLPDGVGLQRGGRLGREGGPLGLLPGLLGLPIGDEVPGHPVTCLSTDVRSSTNRRNR